MRRRLSIFLLLGIFSTAATGCAWEAVGLPESRVPFPTGTLAAPASPEFLTPFLPAAPTLTPGGSAPATAPPDSARRLPSTGDEIPEPALPIAFGPEDINLLLLGSDRRTGTDFRDDVLILVSVDEEEQRAIVLSIPRDLWVYLPGLGMQRINSAYGLGESSRYPGGGMGLLKDTILYNLGIPVHHYARVEMEGFEAIVDTLGGVEVLVACSYTDWKLKAPEDPPEKQDSWRLYTVPAGRVTMDGDLALWYARARSRSSDFDRSRRQQELLRALYRNASDSNLLAHIPSLFRQLKTVISTDLTLKQILDLAPLAARIGPTSVRSRFIGRDQVDNFRVPTSGAAVLVPKAQALRALLDDTFTEAVWGEAGDLGDATVEVIDASHRSGWPELAAERLALAGIATIRGIPAPGSESRTTLIDHRPAQDQARASLLKALRLDTSRLRSEPASDAPTRFVLILADDFNPCFDPSREP